MILKTAKLILVEKNPEKRGRGLTLKLFSVALPVFASEIIFWRQKFFACIKAEKHIHSIL